MYIVACIFIAMFFKSFANQISIIVVLYWITTEARYLHCKIMTPYQNPYTVVNVVVAVDIIVVVVLEHCCCCCYLRELKWLHSLFRPFYLSLCSSL